MQAPAASGYVTEIERYALHDGQGVRTTVFLKGCPLRCRWCCNPETQHFYPEPTLNASRCAGCGRCAKACAHIQPGEGGKPAINRAACAQCVAGHNCAKNCYHGALQLSGTQYNVTEVVDEVLRDATLYDSTGGGVTFSGGEPFCQPGFLLALLQRCKQLYLHTAVETCGAGDGEDYRRAMPYIDTVFLDVKHVDEAVFRQWTGHPLVPLLKNIRLVAGLAAEHGSELVLRVPVVPGFNSREEDIATIADFIAAVCPQASVELLPYHKLGRGKYTLLGRQYRLDGLGPPAEQQMEAYNALLRARGLLPVHY